MIRILQHRADMMVFSDAVSDERLSPRCGDNPTSARFSTRPDRKWVVSGCTRKQSGNPWCQSADERESYNQLECARPEETPLGWGTPTFN